MTCLPTHTYGPGAEDRAWENYSDGALCSYPTCMHVHEVMEQSDGLWYIGACKLCGCEHRYGDEIPEPAAAVQSGANDG